MYKTLRTADNERESDCAICGLVLGKDQSEINSDNLPKIANIFDVLPYFDGRALEVFKISHFVIAAFFFLTAEDYSFRTSTAFRRLCLLLVKQGLLNFLPFTIYDKPTAYCNLMKLYGK